MSDGTFTMVFVPPHDDQTRGWAAALAAAVPEARVVLPETDEDAHHAIRTADAALGFLSPAMLAEATRMRWLQVPQIAPPAGYFSDELVAHPCVATNFRGVYNDHIALHNLAFVLAFARGFQIYWPRQAAREWREEPLDEGVIHLPGTTALIVGVGGIGNATARLLAPLGMRVIGTDARVEVAGDAVESIHPPEELDGLLPLADFVIVTVPHTPETENLFDATKFALMRRTAVFINIGRGQTTVLADLDRALREGQIGGAALDVAEPEPLPRDHPIWDAPNLLITPHTSGYGPGVEERRIAILIDNARRFGRGEPLLNVVDKARWF